MDGWTDISRRVRSRIATLPATDRTPAAMLAAFEDSDFEKMTEIRARVDSVVRDPDTAEHLKAWYRQLCKRPCFHDEYLDAFNTPRHPPDRHRRPGRRRGSPRPGSSRAGGSTRSTASIYASGFEVGTEYTRRTGYDMTGRDGVRLSEYWADGMRTLHGIHVHGFPNLFIVQPTQGANLISNVPHNLVDSARTIAVTLAHAVAGGFAEVEVSAGAEQAWLDLLLTGPGRMMQSPDCTPGYYNNEGRDPGPGAPLGVGYPYGSMAYFAYIDRWRTSGAFDGLEFRRPADV